METYNLAILTKKIYDSGLSLFNLQILEDVLNIKKPNAIFNIIKKLVQAGVLHKLEKNKYVLKKSDVHDFALANFLYQPSYVSFESALNFHGILSQFPYEISSATVRKTKQKKINDRLFTFTSLKKELFWGYEKKNNFIIACPEKALSDQIYLASKGYKKINLSEYDLQPISFFKLKKYLKKYPQTRQFKGFLEKLDNYL